MSFADFLSVCPQNLSRLRVYKFFTTITSKANNSNRNRISPWLKSIAESQIRSSHYKGIHVISRLCLPYKRDIWNIVVNVKCDSEPARLPGGIFVRDVILPQGIFIWDVIFPKGFFTWVVIVTLPMGFFIWNVMSAKSAASSYSSRSQT